jgi:hypothetical protein
MPYLMKHLIIINKQMNQNQFVLETCTIEDANPPIFVLLTLEGGVVWVSQSARSDRSQSKTSSKTGSVWVSALCKNQGQKEAI